MNKLIKGLLLFTALILPVLVFVFLKMFGENQFDIPVFNHTDISPEVNCDGFTTPHVVGEFKIKDVVLSNSQIANIYHIFDAATNELEMRGLMKVKDRLESKYAIIHSIGLSDSTNSIGKLSNKYQIDGLWKMYSVGEQSLRDFVNCELMITGDESLVLIDNEGKIRGYYNGSEGEETDRLILESKILIYGDEQR